MFNLEEFEHDQVIYPLVEKLEKLLDKNKTEKVDKVIKQLEELLVEQQHAISISYILSILAENNFNLINESIIEKLENYLSTNDPKLKVNTLIIIGFAMLSKPKYLDEFCPKFINHLDDRNKDVRDNVFYFLQEVGKNHPNLLCTYRQKFIKALLTEDTEENLISMINFLENCSDFDFETLYNLREVLKSLISQHYIRESSKILSIILSFVKHIYPSLKNVSLEKYGTKELLSAIQNTFLMKKHNFTEISKESGINLKDYIKDMSKKNQKEREIFFYITNKEQKKVYFYELEKQKLEELFGKEEKLQKRSIFKIFSPIIHTDQELRLFINTLIKLGHIKGHYSKLGYFYSYNSIKAEIASAFQSNGMVNLKNFDYLPPDFIHKIVIDVATLTNQVFLVGKNNAAYYSLKNIQKQINTEAAKNTTIDLKSYRDRLTEKDFIKLIKNLPKGFLTYFRAGTQWLTNVGLSKVKKEIENSRVIGYYSIPKLSEKLNVKKELLVQIFENFIDNRSGIFDKNRETFYYSTYLNQKIEALNLLKNQTEKNEQINLIAKNLNIERSHILTKLDENLKLIGEEIKGKELIQINEYIEKTGIPYNLFIEFINDLGLNYFKKV